MYLFPMRDRSMTKGSISKAPGNSPLEEIAGPMDDLARVLRERIARAEEFLRVSRALLENIEGGKPLRSSNRYRNFLPETAMMEFFSNEGRAVTKDELVEELFLGNVKIYSTKMSPESRRGNIRRSIEAQVLAKKVKRLNGLLGHPEWPDEMFTNR